MCMKKSAIKVVYECYNGRGIHFNSLSLRPTRHDIKLLFMCWSSYFRYSEVVTRNSSHRDKNTQSLKTVNKQYKYKCNDQLIELIAVFVQHSYEKVSAVKLSCWAVVWCVFFALDYTVTVIDPVNTTVIHDCCSLICCHITEVISKKAQFKSWYNFIHTL